MFAGRGAKRRKSRRSFQCLGKGRLQIYFGGVASAVGGVCFAFGQSVAWQGNRDTSAMRSIDRTMDVGRVETDGFAVRSTWTDEAIMLTVTARDDTAFAAMYDRYVDLVYSAAVRVLGDAQLAEDATQDVFV